VPAPPLVGDVELEFELIGQSLAFAADNEPPVQFDIDRVLAVAKRKLDHDGVASEHVVEFVELVHIARRLRLDQPRLLVIGKLMVNAALSRSRELKATT
jgi:hypothetical protein